MRDFFAALIPWATIVFAVTSMLAVGLGHSMRKLLGPLRRWTQVLGALGTNFVLTPALAYLLIRLLDLDTPHAIGLFVVGAGAGAPFLIKLAQLARANVAFAASLLILLLPTTVLFLPIVVPLAVPGAEVSAGAIATPLVFTMLLPLAVGMALRPLVPRLAALAPALSQIGTVALIVLFLSIFIAHTPVLVGLGAAAILGAFALILGAFVLGWLLGAQSPGTRDVVALGTAQRNIAAATVVATQTFENVPGVLMMVTAAAVAGMIVLFPLAFALRHGGPALLRRRHA